MPYVIEQIVTYFPLQRNVEGSKLIRELASQTGIIPLRRACVHTVHLHICTCTRAHTHIHTPRFNPRLGSHPFKKSFGWHPYKEILDLVTWGEECAAEVMWPVWGNEWISLFKAVYVCCASCLPALDYSIRHHHVPRDLSQKKKQPVFFSFEFVLINPFLQLLLKLDGMHESFMYYKILFMHPLCCSLIQTQNFIGLALWLMP